MTLKLFKRSYDLNWKCRICERKNYRKIGQHNSLYNLSEEIKLITCEKCLTKSVYPMPSDKYINNINVNYWKIQSDTDCSREFYYEQAKYRVKYLCKYLPDLPEMRILDIGAGHGYIFDFLMEINPNISYAVIEADLNMKKYLEFKGIEEVYSSLNNINADQKFDMIILSHVLEHFNRPVQYLNQIKRLIKQKGYIYIEVPNQDDTYKGNLGLHLFVFNYFSLRFLIETMNMIELNIETFGVSINNLREKCIFKKFYRRKIKKYFPIITTIKTNLELKVNVLRKKDDDYNNTRDKFIFDRRSDLNGRWLRLIAQKSEVL